MDAEINELVRYASGIYERLLYIGVDTADKYVEFVQGLKCYLTEIKDKEKGYYGAIIKRMLRKMKDIPCEKKGNYDFELFVKSLFTEHSYFKHEKDIYYVIDGYTGTSGAIGEIVAEFLLNEYEVNKERKQLFYEEKIMPSLSMR